MAGEEDQKPSGENPEGNTTPEGGDKPSGDTPQSSEGDSGGKDAAYWEQEAKNAFKTRDDLKGKLRELEAIKEQEEQEKVKAEEEKLRKSGDVQGQIDLFKKQLAEMDTRHKTSIERLEKAEGAVQIHLDTLMAQIPEERRSLIPEELSPAQKLEYINKNKELLINTDDKGKNRPAPQGAGAGQGGPEATSFDAFTEIMYSPNATKLLREFMDKNPEQYKEYMERMQADALRPQVAVIAAVPALTGRM